MFGSLADPVHVLQALAGLGTGIHTQ
jgi:hypothetical protein